jgi:hypothetical protein
MVLMISADSPFHEVSPLLLENLQMYDFTNTPDLLPLVTSDDGWF